MFNFRLRLWLGRRRAGGGGLFRKERIERALLLRKRLRVGRDICTSAQLDQKIGKDKFKSEQRGKLQKIYSCRRRTHLDKVFGIVLNFSDPAIDRVILQVFFEWPDQGFELVGPRLTGEPEFDLGWVGQNRRHASVQLLARRGTCQMSSSDAFVWGNRNQPPQE